MSLAFKPGVVICGLDIKNQSTRPSSGAHGVCYLPHSKVFRLVFLRGKRIEWPTYFNTFWEILMGECPVCAGEIKLADDAMTGEVIVCDDCGAELEIVGLDPVKLDEAPSAEEDWGQ
jgi:alpha-aminoadipate carrier protein LysW